MPYAIMRAKKLKTFGNVAASLQHCFRDRETPNADTERTHHNQHFAAHSTDSAMGKLRDRLPEKRRKDAVLAVEYVMTASPEWWKTASESQQQAFFQKSMAWLEAKYGKENIFVATVHHDETSPHLSAFVVPVTADGRLSAKDFIGDRKKMAADQTSFAQAVAPLGLERGIAGSNATHQTIRDYYTGLNQAKAVTETVVVTPDAVRPQVLRKGIFSREEERPEDVATRITHDVQEQIKEIAVKASESVQNRNRTEDLREGIKKIQTQSEGILEAFTELSRKQIDQLKQMVAKMQQENRAEVERKRAEIKARREARSSNRKNTR